MMITRGRGSWWDSLPWPPQTAAVVSAVSPVVVGTGVAAHFGLVPAGKSLAALGIAICLGFGLLGLVGSVSRGAPTRVRLPSVRTVGRLPRSSASWLAAALVLGVWLAATTAWWLLAVGAVGVAAAAALSQPPVPNRAIGRDQLALVAAIELLAGWGTIRVEMGRLPGLGLVAAILPASLATALLILARMRAWSSDPADHEPGTVAGLSRKGTKNLFQGLLGLALAVPLLITVPGLDGAECFLPWLLAPLAEGPLRNSRSAELVLRQRAVRQTAVLLLACSGLLAVGIWTG
ncbi:MAG: hypothetical protein WA751_07345 [Candidatus Dormiibacterota bacterium]